MKRRKDINNPKVLVLKTRCLVNSQNGRPLEFHISDPEGRGDPMVRNPITLQPQRLSEVRSRARAAALGLVAAVGKMMDV